MLLFGVFYNLYEIKLLYLVILFEICIFFQYLKFPLFFPSIATSQKGVPEIIRAGKVLLSVTEETFDPLTPPNQTPQNKPRDQEPTVKLPTNAGESHNNIADVSSVQKTLSVTGTVSAKKAQVTASISGLELGFEMRNLSGSLYRNKHSNAAESEKNKKQG